MLFRYFHLLDLTISIPGSSGGRGETGLIDLDINQVPDERNDRRWMTTAMNGNSSADLEDLEDDHYSNGGGGGSSGPRNKLRLSKDQSRLLEESFRLNHTLSSKRKEAHATQLQLKPRQVEVWFQNRRASLKQHDLLPVAQPGKYTANPNRHQIFAEVEKQWKDYMCQS